MRYAFMRIRTKEVEMVDANNCVKRLIKGFVVTPIETIDANSDEEAIEIVMKNYHDLLASYEEDRDYLEWLKKDVSEDGKIIFASLYVLSQEGETIDWRYNG